MPLWSNRQQMLINDDLLDFSPIDQLIKRPMCFCSTLWPWQEARAHTANEVQEQNGLEFGLFIHAKRLTDVTESKHQNKQSGCTPVRLSSPPQTTTSRLGSNLAFQWRRGEMPTCWHAGEQRGSLILQCTDRTGPGERHADNPRPSEWLKTATVGTWPAPALSSKHTPKHSSLHLGGPVRPSTFPERPDERLCETTWIIVYTWKATPQSGGVLCTRVYALAPRYILTHRFLWAADYCNTYTHRLYLMTKDALFV